MELDGKHTLAGLFSVTADLLHARTGTKDVPEAHGAIMATGNQREASSVKRDGGDGLEMRQDGLCTLACGSMSS